MGLLSAVLIPFLGLVTVGLSAEVDDPQFPVPPTPTSTDNVPSFTFPAPMGSSAETGIISNGEPPPVDSGSRPMVEPHPPANDGILWQRNPVYPTSTIDQFQSSSYWAAPQAFHPATAPDYGSGLARGCGTHVRYPYFKYRAPWTYQGPAGISHTIDW